MKKKIISIGLVCAALLATQAMASALPTPSTTKAQPLNGIVATVNDEIITQVQLDHAMVAANQQLTQNHMYCMHITYAYIAHK